MNKSNNVPTRIAQCNNPYSVMAYLIAVTGIYYCITQVVSLAKERDITVSYNGISVSVTSPKQLNQQESESTTKQIPKNINHPAQ